MVEPETDAARFWHFALSVYRPDDNRALFLRIQDEGGADVPLVLFCLWCGAERWCVSNEAMRAAVDFSTTWRQARVEPLRALRRGWKGVVGNMPADLSEQARQHVAQAEQAIERLQMGYLAALREGARPVENAARANLDLYCRLAVPALTPDDLDRLASLV